MHERSGFKMIEILNNMLLNKVCVKGIVRKIFLVSFGTMLIICSAIPAWAATSTDIGISLNDDNEDSEEGANMVDERFELLSLVFRLAGHEEYGDLDTEYQQELASVFKSYSNHPAVKYASKLKLGYDAVFKFSVHILKYDDGFVFIDDIDSLVEDGRWTKLTAAEFLELLNDFYIQSDFGTFYREHMPFYEDVTARFIDRTYSSIDQEWFRIYVDPDNLRCVYAPSSSRHNYGATVNETIVYSAVSSDGSAIVHEYCHSFANPIAHKWYDENEEFKKICDATLDPIKLPNYTDGKIIAGEYVTRAYNALYDTEHGFSTLPLLLAEKANGFTYIEDVYAMITTYTKVEFESEEKKIEAIIGVRYEKGSAQEYSTNSRKFNWNVLALSEPLSGLYRPTEVGNIFKSNTGEVLYVRDSSKENAYLMIDLGETVYQGMDGFRIYSRIPLD